MIRTIGFTEVYYTLWEVWEPVKEPVYHNGVLIGTNTFQEHFYIQNLSKDFEAAQAKLKSKGYEFKVDLELRGSSYFRRLTASDIKNREDYYGHDCFSFGRMEGTKFSEATDKWQLWRAYSEEKSARRRTCARRRLIELGALVKYNWLQEVWKPLNDDQYDERGNWIQVKRKYATPRQISDDRIKKCQVTFLHRVKR
jgi:hypothetical protein